MNINSVVRLMPRRRRAKPPTAGGKLDATRELLAGRGCPGWAWAGVVLEPQHSGIPTPTLHFLKIVTCRIPTVDVDLGVSKNQRP